MPLEESAEHADLPFVDGRGSASKNKGRRSGPHPVD
jgi:hypothetical protein